MFLKVTQRGTIIESPSSENNHYSMHRALAEAKHGQHLDIDVGHGPSR